MTDIMPASITKEVTITIKQVTPLGVFGVRLRNGRVSEISKVVAGCWLEARAWDMLELALLHREHFDNLLARIHKEMSND